MICENCPYLEIKGLYEYCTFEGKCPNKEALTK